jgi:hypothetical protein
MTLSPANARALRRYGDNEYQYEQTARASLTLLDHGQKYVRVYCDWHDDFVIETGDDPAKYLFYQVKARGSSQGPWPFQGVFGVAKKIAPVLGMT